ncbi:MAG: UvrB/UvrC motif-containing protein [Planctomycetota bacterium]|nr:UvrB/UvrC motif-containing protein [Planctomycetota bacterium]
MKCENCGKRDATVHLTEITKGVKQEIHLCEPCASEKGLPGKAHFSISDLLAGITSASQAKKGRQEKDVQCPTCELTLSQFQSSGRFGCPDCYTTFKDDILPLVEKIHDSSQHVGKVPNRVSQEVGLQKELRHLQLELKRTVKREDYEKAAQLRDQIRIVEEKIKGAGEAAPPPAKGRKKSGESGKKGGA